MTYPTKHKLRKWVSVWSIERCSIEIDFTVISSIFHVFSDDVSDFSSKIFQYLWFKWDKKKYEKSGIFISKYFLLSIGNMSAGNLLPESLMTVHWPTPSAFCLWPSQFQKLHFCQKDTYDTIDSDSESRSKLPRILWTGCLPLDTELSKKRRTCRISLICLLSIKW